MTNIKKLKKEFEEKFCYKKFPYDNSNLRFMGNVTNKEVWEWILDNFDSKIRNEIDLYTVQNLEHGDQAILIAGGIAYKGQIVVRTNNNDFIYRKFFVMPLQAPLQIFDENKTDLGLIFKIR